MKPTRVFEIPRVLLILAIAGLPHSAPAQSWDAAAEYLSSQNPNGVWTYGWSSTLGGAVTPFNVFGAFCGGVSGWLLPGSPYNHPTIARNTTATTKCCTTVRMPPGRIISHPGPQGQYAVLRWTAPAAGNYHVSAGFGGLDFSWPTSSNVALLHNGALVFGSQLQGFHGPSSCTATNYSTPQSFTGVLPLLAGDTIDAVVGFGQNGFFNGDSTLVDLVIDLAGSVQTLGVSCGEPVLLALTIPVLGLPATLSLAAAPPVVSGTVFFSLGSPVPLAIGNGCSVFVDLSAFYPLVPLTTDGSGAWSMIIGLPTDPQLRGLRVTVQAFLSPVPIPQGYVITNGLDVVF